MPLEVGAFWPAHRLVVEVDTFATHGDRMAFERDRRKDAVLGRDRDGRAAGDRPGDGQRARPRRRHDRPGAGPRRGGMTFGAEPLRARC